MWAQKVEPDESTLDVPHTSQERKVTDELFTLTYMHLESRWGEFSAKIKQKQRNSWLPIVCLE